MILCPYRQNITIYYTCILNKDLEQCPGLPSDASVIVAGNALALCVASDAPLPTRVTQGANLTICYISLVGEGSKIAMAEVPLEASGARRH